MQITRSAGRSGDHMLIDSLPRVTEQSASLITQDLINLWACVCLYAVWIWNQIVCVIVVLSSAYVSCLC